MRSRPDKPSPARLILLALVLLLGVGCRDEVALHGETVARNGETAAPTVRLGKIWQKRLFQVPTKADWDAIGRTSRELRREGLRVSASLEGVATFSVAEGSAFDPGEVVTALLKANLNRITLVQVMPGTYVLQCGFG